MPETALADNPQNVADVTPGPGSNRTAALNELARTAAAGWSRTVDEWLATARAVHEARQIAVHGEWAGWLSATGIPRRTATRMIRVVDSGVSDKALRVYGIAETEKALTFWPAEIIESHDFDLLLSRMWAVETAQRVAAEALNDAALAEDLATARVIAERRPKQSDDADTAFARLDRMGHAPLPRHPEPWTI